MTSSIRPSDTVFIRTGEPLLVKERDPNTGSLKLERDEDEVRTATRHGYLNGLSPEARAQLYEILDQAKKGEGEGDAPPEQRIERLRTQLEAIEQDPRNLNIARYVRAELTHLVNTFGLKPKEYTVHESRIR